VQKSDWEIMKFWKRLTRPGVHSAADLVGVDLKTTRRYVAASEEGRPVDGTVKRPRIIDPSLARSRVGGPVRGQGPRRHRPRTVAETGVHRRRADHPPGGPRAEVGLVCRSSPAVGLNVGFRLEDA